MILSRLKIRPIVEQDLAIILSWRNADHIRKYMYNDQVITISEHEAWYRNVLSDNSKRVLMYEMDDQPMGIMNITQIDSKTQTCNWGFYIGPFEAPKGAGRGLGQLALRFIFNELLMRKCYGEVLDYNEKSRAFHERFGFVQENVLPNHVIRNGKPLNVVLYSLSAEEWAKYGRKEIEL